ncbi:HD domain-containing protein [Ornithinibacillus sp. L9]|uniref:HD domain-containing protein n=1 Tax=Ornithinibacillus caprae TaxID=2678566 RepID=A0A6N8FIM8_9BACI|nr:HD-GYP domain-containing protein [Ornithinibacillus caprae]MUK88124.1 HD domain-containing protein [Ornithinibacillus caprae]
MRVSPSQLVHGCVLLKDVVGKTNRPIIPKKTVLTNKHINVLERFLVEKVEVSERLHDGKVYIPKPESKKEEHVMEEHKEIDISTFSFKEHYFYVVENYQKLFDNWRNNAPIDMLVVRNLVIPLIERMDDIGSAIYSLHRYTNKIDYFYHHSVSVAIIAAFLGKKLGYEKGEWIQLGLAGFLSDAGMAKLSPGLFKKAGSLTHSERAEMIKHPTYSYRLLEQNSSVSYAIKLAVLQHHERIDGSGYPLGLSKDKIHQYAMIIAVCDIYHAMTSDRIYKEKQSPFKVIEELQREQYTKLDLTVVQTFIEALSNFSIGTTVKLSNSMIGQIVFMDDKSPTRPIVKLIEQDSIISLKDEKDLFIDEIVNE